MKTIMAMIFSITIMMTMMIATATLINYLEGDILPDSSPWSFINLLSSSKGENGVTK